MNIFSSIHWYRRCAVYCGLYRVPIEPPSHARDLLSCRARSKRRGVRDHRSAGVDWSVEDVARCVPEGRVATHHVHLDQP